MMKAGYKIDYSEWLSDEMPDIIDCSNYHGLNLVKFYGWRNNDCTGLDHNTVAIFKIKPKAK